MWQPYNLFNRTWNAADEDEDECTGDQEDVPDQGRVKRAASAIEGKASTGHICPAIEVGAEAHSKAEQKQQSGQGAAPGPETEDQTEATCDFNPGEDDGKGVDQQEREYVVGPHGLGKQARLGNFDQARIQERTPQEEAQQ